MIVREDKMSAQNLFEFFKKVLGGKSEHQRAGYFLTGSSGNRKPAPQKQTS
jgi:hypothetical protein